MQSARRTFSQERYDDGNSSQPKIQFLVVLRIAFVFYSECSRYECFVYTSGDYQAAIEEHQQELALSEVSHDIIGCAVANRKIGECYAELGNIEAALKVKQSPLD